MAKHVVLISGAGGALGRACARAFEGAGWQLALLARSSASQAKLQGAHPEAVVLQADLSDEEQAGAAVHDVEARCGRIDALLNLAGGFATGAAQQVGAADLRTMLELNLWTAFNLSRAALPGMLARRSGFILGVAARQALQGGARASAYAASKAGLAAYLKSLQAEVGKEGIGVSVLYPMGAIDTEANRQAMPDKDPASFISRQALAEAALFLATRPANARVPELMVYPD